MPKVAVAGLQDVKPEELLANSRYTVDCYRSQIIDREGGNKSLALNFVVRAGPTQEGNVSPEDRRLSDFFPLTNFENMKDGGTFVKRKLREACDAFGVEIDDDGSFDSDDFLLKQADVVTRNKDNRDTGVAETSINKYLKQS
jgi:hypothetical protein